jgi:hypothetical protein
MLAISPGHQINKHEPSARRMNPQPRTWCRLASQIGRLA